MKRKKIDMLISTLFFIVVYFIACPTDVFAVSSCVTGGCKGGTLDNGCTVCCYKFENNEKLGKEKFNVDDFYNVYGNNCDLYIENFSKTENVTGSDAISYCESKCSDKSGSVYSSCYNTCCKEKSCSTEKTTPTPTPTPTDGNKNETKIKTNTAKTCQSILGDPDNDPNSVAWLIQKILDYLKILGPLLVIVLSSVDFGKAIVMSDEENMKKAQKKLITRLLAAALLFFIPTIVELLLDIFGITGSCGVA